MKYIVAAENDSYNQWQLELLIESFKLIGEENKLILALWKSKKPEKHGFKTNIAKHPLKFSFQDLNRYPYPQLNQLYSIKFALESGLLTTPFMVMKPDTVIFQSTIQNKQKYDLILNIDDNLNFTYKAALCAIPFLTKYLPNGYWMGFNYPIIFNNINIDRLIEITESLVNEQLTKLKTIWKHTDRLALILYYILENKTFDLGSYCQNLLSNELTKNFLNYEHGLPPKFSKYHFKYENDFILSNKKNPFAAIMAETPTYSSYLLSKIAESYATVNQI